MNTEHTQPFIDLLAIARIKWGNLDPDANRIMDEAKASIGTIAKMVEALKKIAEGNVECREVRNGEYENDARHYYPAHENAIRDLATEALSEMSEYPVPAWEVTPHIQHEYDSCIFLASEDPDGRKAMEYAKEVIEHLWDTSEWNKDLPIEVKMRAITIHPSDIIDDK
jgi:hypothetical protein